MTVQLMPSSVSAQLCNLLLRWQELRQQGQNPAAEELCASRPHLLEELQRQIQALESMEAILGCGAAHHTGGTGPASSENRGDRLPARSRSARDGWTSAERFAIPGYELLDVLDQGGMGIVYKARHVQLKRLVALKMILAGAHARPEQLARFRTEVEATAELRHPNIVQIYEVGEFQGQPYFTMEFVEGGNLATVLAGKPLPARQAAELLQVLASAVAAAHERGIIHRDLKPSNVLLQIAGRGDDLHAQIALSSLQSAIPKITDFGLAKRISELESHSIKGQDGEAPGASGDATLPLPQPLTQSGAIIGTASYMAPEQAEGKTKDIGPLVDVYALGAILYELLTGRPPFQGETTLDTLLQVRQQDAVAPRRLQPRVPRDLETICLKCMQKEPRRRYAGAAALAEDLRRFLGGESIQARPTAVWEKAGKWAWRRPALASLLAVSVVAAATLLAGWIGFTATLHNERETARREEKRALVQEQLARDQQHRAEEEHARAQALLHRACNAIGEYGRAVEEGKLVARINDDPGSLLFVLARFYALASAASGKDPELQRADRAEFAEQYAAHAVELLAKARRLGYFRSADRIAKLKNDDWRSVRERPAFRSLLAAMSTTRGRSQ